MASILKVDKIRGTGLDSDTISLDGSGNITIPKNVTFTGTTTGAGAMEIITGLTTGGQGVASQEISLSTSSDYMYQKIVIRGLYSTTVADLQLYLNTQGGSYVSSYDARVNEGISNSIGSNTTGGTGGTSQSHIRMNWYSLGNAANEPNLFTIDIHHSDTASIETIVTGTRSGSQSDGHYAVGFFGGRSRSEEINDKIKLVPSSGSGLYIQDFIVYGIKRT